MVTKPDTKQSQALKNLGALYNMFWMKKSKYYANLRR